MCKGVLLIGLETKERYVKHVIYIKKLNYFSSNNGRKNYQNKMCSQVERCVECNELFNKNLMINLLNETEEGLVCEECCDYLENGCEDDEDEEEEEDVVHLIEQ